MPKSFLVPKSTLVELFTRASAAARIVGHLDDRVGEHVVEHLAGHVDAIVDELGGLLGARHLTVVPLPVGDARARRIAAPLPIDEFRQLMARADALASATVDQFCRVVVLVDGDDRRGFKRLAHLVELTASTVSAASDASDRLIAAVERAMPPEGL